MKLLDLLSFPHLFFHIKFDGNTLFSEQLINDLIRNLINVKTRLAFTSVYFLYDKSHVFNITDLLSQFSFLVTIIKNANYHLYSFIFSNIEDVKPFYRKTNDITEGVGFNTMALLPLSVKSREIFYYGNVDYNVIANKNIKPAIFMCEGKVQQTVTETDSNFLSTVYAAPFIPTLYVYNSTTQTFTKVVKFENDEIPYAINGDSLYLFINKTCRYMIVYAVKSGTITLNYNIAQFENLSLPNTFDVEVGANLIDFGTTIAFKSMVPGSGPTPPQVFENQFTFSLQSDYDYFNFPKISEVVGTEDHSNLVAILYYRNYTNSTQDFSLGTPLTILPYSRGQYYQKSSHYIPYVTQPWSASQLSQRQTPYGHRVIVDANQTGMVYLDVFNTWHYDFRQPFTVIKRKDANMSFTLVVFSKKGTSKIGSTYYPYSEWDPTSIPITLSTILFSNAAYLSNAWIISANRVPLRSTLISNPSTANYNKFGGVENCNFFNMGAASGTISSKTIGNFPSNSRVFFQGYAGQEILEFSQCMWYWDGTNMKLRDTGFNILEQSNLDTILTPLPTIPQFFKFLWTCGNTLSQNNLLALPNSIYLYDLPISIINLKSTFTEYLRSQNKYDYPSTDGYWSGLISQIYKRTINSNGECTNCQWPYVLASPNVRYSPLVCPNCKLNRSTELFEKERKEFFTQLDNEIYFARNATLKLTILDPWLKTTYFETFPINWNDNEKKLVYTNAIKAHMKVQAIELDIVMDNPLTILSDLSLEFVIPTLFSFASNSTINNISAISPNKFTWLRFRNGCSVVSSSLYSSGVYDLRYSVTLNKRTIGTNFIYRPSQSTVKYVSFPLPNQSKTIWTIQFNAQAMNQAFQSLVGVYFNSLIKAIRWRPLPVSIATQPNVADANYNNANFFRPLNQLYYGITYATTDDLNAHFTPMSFELMLPSGLNNLFGLATSDLTIIETLYKCLYPVISHSGATNGNNVFSIDIQDYYKTLTQDNIIYSQVAKASNFSRYRLMPLHHSLEKKDIYELSTDTQWTADEFSWYQTTDQSKYVFGAPLPYNSYDGVLEANYEMLGGGNISCRLDPLATQSLYNDHTFQVRAQSLENPGFLFTTILPNDTTSVNVYPLQDPCRLSLLMIREYDVNFNTAMSQLIDLGNEISFQTGDAWQLPVYWALTSPIASYPSITIIDNGCLSAVFMARENIIGNSHVVADDLALQIKNSHWVLRNTERSTCFKSYIYNDYVYDSANQEWDKIYQINEENCFIEMAYKYQDNLPVGNSISYGKESLVESLITTNFNFFEHYDIQNTCEFYFFIKNIQWTPAVFNGLTGWSTNINLPTTLIENRSYSIYVIYPLRVKHAITMYTNSSSEYGYFPICYHNSGSYEYHFNLKNLDLLRTIYLTSRFSPETRILSLLISANA